MERFIQKYHEDVTGVLSGFDRLVIRGTIRSLAVAAGMMHFLSFISMLLKDFGAYAERTTERLKVASLEAARRLDRPIRYLPSSSTRKEAIAHEIAEADGIGEGLVCVLTCVEPCMSYEIQRNREQKKLILQPRQRKCLHLYHYWIDPVFGFMNARIQTWFPFTIQVCLNGREWLSKQMDRVGMRYTRRENCFPWIEDLPTAQRLMDQQLRLDWPLALNRIAEQLNPAHEAIFAPYRAAYYWSVHQSEWATDILFRSPAALARIYPALVRGAISTFSSEDVMRFLGRKLTGHFQGEVVSDYKKRPEGVRIKHQVKGNSIKLYDKQGSVLRPETTINNAGEFKVFRSKEGDPDGPKDWRRMRKGIADLHRRAEVSQACNERYLDALATLDTDRPVGDIVDTICRPVKWKGQRVRAMRPWSIADRTLLQTVSRGEFAVNGFRNRDLLAHLFPRRFPSAKDKRRAVGRITRLIRMLRAHRLIRKAPRTYRYVLTPRGREIASAVLKCQDLTLEQVNKAAA